MNTLGHSGIKVFPLALGGNTFGWTSDPSGSREVLDAFVEAGGNFVDTADGYSAWVPGNSGGESETIIGSWMAERKNRDRVVVATKVSQHPDFRGLAASNIAAAADASLKRLRTDYIDVYYAHFDDPDTPLAETVEAFDALVKAGKVRAIGLSNYGAGRIRSWIEIARAANFVLPVALQPHYNLVKRAAYERDIAPVAADAGLAVMPYFALASGFLTGKYRTKDDLAGASREQLANAYYSSAGLAVVDVLRDIAARHGAEPATVALAWLRQRPDVAAPLASARNVEQLPALIASAELELDDLETAALDNISARVPE